MKKKIIIISPAFPLRGGIVDSAHALAYALEDIGHNVQILSFSLQYPSFLFPGKTQYDHNGSKPHLNIVTRMNSINPISWIRCAFWLRKERPDIVITRYWIPYIGLCLGTILRLSGLKKHISLVALCDNVIPHEKRIGDHFLTKYFFLVFLLLFFIFFFINKVNAIENKILVKVDNHIITSVDILNKINYLPDLV